MQLRDLDGSIVGCNAGNEATVQASAEIVRMIFEVKRAAKQFLLVELVACQQFIAGDARYDSGGAAAHASCERNLVVDIQMKQWKGAPSTFCGIQRDLIDQVLFVGGNTVDVLTDDVDFQFVGRFHRDAQIARKPKTQSVKARSEVGRTCRNAEPFFAMQHKPLVVR